MLKKRIIPIVLLDGFSVLKTINFKNRRNLGSPVTVMRTYNTRNVDEMILLDIDASKQSRPIDKFTIKEISRDCFMPLTVGGGIKSCKDIEELLNVGADKISLNTSAYQTPLFIKEAASNFGSQCIVISVDVVKIDQKYHLYSNNGVLTGVSVTDWIAKAQDLGAGEILINDVSKDGTMSGFDVVLAEMLTNLLEIPLIYAGGISNPINAVDLVKVSNADAVGISSIFHFTDFTPEDCRKALISAGIPARKDS
jgi:cyclase